MVGGRERGGVGDGRYGVNRYNHDDWMQGSAWWRPNVEESEILNKTEDSIYP